MVERAKMQRKWVLKPTHAEWCREGVLFRHEVVVNGRLEICAWCSSCTGGYCPRCEPGRTTREDIARRTRASKGLSGPVPPEPWRDLEQETAT